MKYASEIENLIYAHCAEFGIDPKKWLAADMKANNYTYGDGVNDAVSAFMIDLYNSCGDSETEIEHVNEILGSNDIENADNSIIGRMTEKMMIDDFDGWLFSHVCNRRHYLSIDVRRVLGELLNADNLTFVQRGQIDMLIENDQEN